MYFLHNAISVAAALLFGIALGLAAWPADGNALERVDFAGVSQMGDPDCARIARQAGQTFVATTFEFYDLRNTKIRYCDLSAIKVPRPAFSPQFRFGQARARFALWGIYADRH